MFGAITSTTPTVFDAGASAGCGPLATAFFEIVKTGAGNAVDPRSIGAFFDMGAANISITKIRFTMPVVGKKTNQQPYFDNGVNPELSIAVVGSDALNRFNPTMLDYRGVAPDPDSGSGNWKCTAAGSQTNPDGDLCFEFENQIPRAGASEPIAFARSRSTSPRALSRRPTFRRPPISSASAPRSIN